MTIKEFAQTQFSAGMSVRHTDGRRSEIVSVDFGENLIGVFEDGGTDIQYWRCENCTIVSTITANIATEEEDARFQGESTL